MPIWSSWSGRSTGMDGDGGDVYAIRNLGDGLGLPVTPWKRPTYNLKNDWVVEES